MTNPSIDTTVIPSFERRGELATMKAQLFCFAILVLASLAFVGLLQAQTVTPQRLVEVVDLGNPVISPDGQRVAFRAEYPTVERNTYDTVWYVQDVDGSTPPLWVADGGVPLRIYHNGTVALAPAIWSPDGRWIFFRAHLDGRIAVWRAATDGSGAHPVTSDAGDVREFNLSADGATMEYSVGATREEVDAAEQAEYDRGVRIDSKIFLSAGLIGSSMIEGRRSTFRFQSMDSWNETGPLLADVPDQWRIVDLRNMSTRSLPASRASESASQLSDVYPKIPSIRKAAVNSEDGRIALLIDKEQTNSSGRTVNELLFLKSAHFDEPIRCGAELCVNQEISEVQWRPGTDEVLFKIIDRSIGIAHAIFAWNVSTDEMRVVTRSRGVLAGDQKLFGGPCSVSSTSMVCVAAEADRPPRVDVVDLASGKRWTLFEPNKSLEVDIAEMAPARLILWQDEQGREFTGHLFAAHGAEAPPPLFVNFYGCLGFLRGGVGDEWPLASFAEAGISALCINSLAGYPDFVKRQDQARQAIEAVVRVLSESGDIDPNRVGMGGISFGSEATMWTAANSDVLSAASASTPSITHLYHLFYTLRDSKQPVLQHAWQLGAPNETPEQWRIVSPQFHLDRIEIPMLFQMAEQEYLLSLEYALPLIHRKQAEMYVFADEAHLKFQPRHMLAAYERNLDWFRFWLQGWEDDSLHKEEQYKQWHEMRERICERATKETKLWYCQPK